MFTPCISYYLPVVYPLIKFDISVHCPEQIVVLTQVQASHIIASIDLLRQSILVPCEPLNNNSYYIPLQFELLHLPLHLHDRSSIGSSDNFLVAFFVTSYHCGQLHIVLAPTFLFLFFLYLLKSLRSLFPLFCLQFLPFFHLLCEVLIYESQHSCAVLGPHSLLQLVHLITNIVTDLNGFFL